MRFALLSIVDLREKPFISLLIYETYENGISSIIGDIAKPYDNFDDLLDDLLEYRINELQTDSQEVYRKLINVKFPVIYRREVEGTRQSVKANEDILCELYELEEIIAPVIPIWRLWCIDKLERLITILKTKGIKTNENI